ncbi:hypothetical protein CLORY_39320 [Clostridium oryzae]|uniref:Uncharacterized protein n=1 Tax=Clostridium oryzae TaxID=1450648 RepID=A0A1V4ICT7_9CLOT|nr:hypothetical protein CLORY_39320 [Clostridium oryzae]
MKGVACVVKNKNIRDIGEGFICRKVVLVLQYSLGSMG